MCYFFYKNITYLHAGPLLLPLPLHGAIHRPRPRPLKGLKLSASFQRAELKGNASQCATVYGKRDREGGAEWKVSFSPMCVPCVTLGNGKKSNLTLHLIAIYCKIAHTAGCFQPDSVYFGHSLLLALFFRLADIHSYALLIAKSPKSESAWRNALRVG